MADYTPESYDPLDTPRLTSAICLELERQPLIGLGPEIPRFEGSGLYAIYYRGDGLSLYTPLTGYDIPVYAGQAVSHNSATGRTTGRPDPLWHRVRDHRRSIASADLPLDEFAVRLLRLPDVHANLGENGLRVFYQPVWNSVLTGFGNHEQGSTTRQGQRTKWDAVHPGRGRTYGADNRDPDALAREAADHIAGQLARYNQAPWRQGPRG